MAVIFLSSKRGKYRQQQQQQQQLFWAARCRHLQHHVPWQTQEAQLRTCCIPLETEWML